MSELPQVGQTYKHHTCGEVIVTAVHKRGRGYNVSWHGVADNPEQPVPGGSTRLKDWQKATT